MCPEMFRSGRLSTPVVAIKLAFTGNPIVPQARLVGRGAFAPDRPQVILGKLAARQSSEAIERAGVIVGPMP
jgi:hypothetical protein